MGAVRVGATDTYVTRSLGMVRAQDPIDVDAMDMKNNIHFDLRKTKYAAIMVS